MSRGGKGPRQFEDVFRIYHEVEDVGKTVKASKRRARWTFCFGETGEEREVVLIHSVVSGKKVITYNGDEIHHNDELSRAFSYTWYDGDHMLRVDILDIVEVGTSMAKQRGDKMYELTLDGVPFNILPVKPMYPASRSKPSAPARKSSFGATTSSQPSFNRQGSALGGAAEDDFNPRGMGTTKAIPATKAKPMPAVDLLGVGDDVGPTTQAAVPSGTFDPFGGPDPFTNPRGTSDFGDFKAAPTATKAAPSSTFDAFAPAPHGRSGSAMTAHDLAMELGTSSFNAAPSRAATGGSAAFALPPSQPTTTSSSSAFGVSDPFQPTPQAQALGPVTEVDKVTASLVNLNNLLDDKPAQVVNVYKPTYTDNRSLEELKASQPKTASQPAKPIFIERPAPAFPQAGPRPGPGFGPGPAPMGGGGFGAFPPGPPMMGGPPRPGLGGPMPMMGGGFPPPRPLMGGGGPTGLGPSPFGPGPGGPPMMNAFPPNPQFNAFGGPVPPRPTGPGFLPPRPPSNDPFAGLSGF